MLETFRLLRDYSFLEQGELRIEWDMGMKGISSNDCKRSPTESKWGVELKL